MFVKPLPDETRVLEQLRCGDEASFNQIYRHYSPYIYKRVLLLLHSPQLAEDVTQEIFMKVWQDRFTMAEIRSLTSYLLVVARNHTLNVLKKASRTREGMGEIIHHFDTTSHSTEYEVLNNEYSSFIQRKLSELPPRSREIFVMCREQSRSYSEVAETLGISRDAVKSRMVHVMKIMRSSVKKEIGLSLLILINCHHLVYCCHT